MTLFDFTLTPTEWTLFYLVALFIGMSKTGVHGAGMMVVPWLAAIFGGQSSSGILLPVLCIADIFGVWYYHRHASWVLLKKLFPWALAGTILGTSVGSSIDDHVFKMIMAVVILGSVVMMLWLERGHRDDVPDHPWFAAATGIAGGFTSMVGNLAGSVMAVYFLSMRLPKAAFIGTTAWFFMVMNWVKIPFHVWSWHTITWSSVALDLTTIPVVLLGAALGVVVVRRMPERIYRAFIIGMTILAAVFMLIR